MATGCMIPLTRNVQNGQLYGDRKPISSCQRKGKWDTGSDCQRVERASFWSDGGALELDSGGGCAPLRLYKKAGNCAHGNWEVYGTQIIFKLFPVTFFKTIPPIMAVSNCSLLTVCRSGPCLWRKSAAPRRGQRPRGEWQELFLSLKGCQIVLRVALLLSTTATPHPHQAWKIIRL